MKRFLLIVGMALCAVLAFGQASQNNFPGAATSVSVNGAVITPSGLQQNTVMVDGVTNPSLMAAMSSSTCFTATQSGCSVFSDRPEIIQANPFLGTPQYTVTLGKGQGTTAHSIWSTVPLVPSNDILQGSGRVNSSNVASTGSGVFACDGDTGCNGMYFPNAPPPAPTCVTGATCAASSAAGTLASGNYLVRIAWVVDLNTAPDATATASLPAWSANLTTVTGLTAIQDSNGNTEVAVNAGTTGTGSHPTWNASVGGRTLDGSVIWQNIGVYTTSTTWHSAGYSLASGPSTALAVTGPGEVTVQVSAATTYPACQAAPGPFTGTLTAVTVAGSLTTYTGSGLPAANTLVGYSFTFSAFANGLNNVPNAVIVSNTTTTLVVATTTQVAATTQTGTATAAGYPNATIVTGPLSNNTRLYRYKGTPTSAQTCTMAIPGSKPYQIADQGGYWEEVGPVAGPCGGNASACYLPIAGFTAFLTAAGGAENTELKVNLGSGGNATCSGAALNIGGNDWACPLGQTMTITAVPASIRLPYEDTTHPLVVQGEAQNTGSAPSFFQTRVQHLTLSANYIAGEALLLRMGQEQSGGYDLDATSGVEAIVACKGGGAQNSTLDDFNITNRNIGNFDQERVALIINDEQDGVCLRNISNGTANSYHTPQNSSLSQLVPAGLDCVGVTMCRETNVHHEDSQDGVYCHGNSPTSGNMACQILGVEGTHGLASATTNSMVHLGKNVQAALVFAQSDATVTATIQDDNVKAGKGNCNSTNSWCPGGTGANWSPYIAGRSGFFVGGTLATTDTGGLNFAPTGHINANGNTDIAGTCTMNGSTGCPAITFSTNYAAAPSCTATWTGGGALTGIVKAVPAVGSLTISSSVAADTAVMAYHCDAPTN
jgi:hypothetical protein